MKSLIPGATRLFEAAPSDGASGGAATAKVVEVVEFAGGRKVEFVGLKRKMLKESIFPEGSPPIVRLDFRNGETREFTIPSELLFKFAAHGAEQKLGDETAGEEDIDDMVLAVDALITRLSARNADGTFAGEWSTKREGGMSGTSMLMKALMEFSKKTKEEIMEFLKNKSTADKAALRASKQIKPIIERLEAEKLSKAAKVDTDALLGSLGGA